MRFIKVCANGTDYILCRDADNETKEKAFHRASELCGRNTGIGAFGVINADVQKNVITLDTVSAAGDRRAFDADAAVCLAAVSEDRNFTVSMPDGELRIRKTDAKGICDVDFEKGSFLPDDIPLACSYPVIGKAVEAGNRIVILTALRLGGVYAVHETYDLDKLNTDYLGERITAHSLFLKKADAVFVQKTDEHACRVRCYRRKTGLVPSDIGAAAAALTAMCRLGRFPTGEPVDISFDIGEVTALCRRDHSVLLKTSVSAVYEGIIDL